MLTILLHLLIIYPATLFAQTNLPPEGEVLKAIAYHDSIFWEAYNRCDVETMSRYFTEDLEFYHDKGGPVFTRLNFVQAMSQGLCGNPDWRLRREAVPGSVRVFPLNKYGGLISGEHLFYINEKGKKEVLDGYGKFTQLWQFINGEWKMSRVISYDHGPAEEKLRERKEQFPK